MKRASTIALLAIIVFAQNAQSAQCRIMGYPDSQISLFPPNEVPIQIVCDDGYWETVGDVSEQVFTKFYSTARRLIDQGYTFARQRCEVVTAIPDKYDHGTVMMMDFLVVSNINSKKWPEPEGNRAWVGRATQAIDDLYTLGVCEW